MTEDERKKARARESRLITQITEVNISDKNKESILDDLEFCELNLNKDKAGQSYLVKYGTNWQLQSSYIGMVIAAKESGLKSLNVQLVYACDKFEVKASRIIGQSPYIHTYDPFLSGREKYPLKGGYFEVVTANGGFEYGEVTAEDIEKSKKMTKSKDQFWGKWEKQMRMKTVIRAAMKTQPRTDKFQRIQDLHDATFQTYEEREAKTATVPYVEQKIESTPKSSKSSNFTNVSCETPKFDGA